MARPEFPLAAVAGCERVKLALSLLAIDPLLKGIVIRGGRGSGKTLLARSIQPLLPAGSPFVEVPSAVTMDRLAGGTDWTAVLAGRRYRTSEGLLQKAKGGVLFSDHASLLPVEAIGRIAAELNASGSFVWVSAYDPDEGEPPPLLSDAIGLVAEVDAADSPATRETVARRALEFQSSPNGFVEAFAAATSRETERVNAARRLLPRVTVDRDLLRQLCERAADAGVEGNRAEVFGLRAIRAHAALCGRSFADESDVLAADELTLRPRFRAAARGALPPDCAGRPRPVEGRQSHGVDAQPIPAPPIDNPAPALPLSARLAGSSASGGRRARQRAESDAGRGRYSGALRRDPGHGAVAVDATLRAAAPLQKLRGASGRIRVLPGDLRYKRFRRRSGIAIVIALDASGSMASNRIRQAKGAVIRLLRDVYAHRDSVALVAFRGDRADLLMKTGRSVELARRALDDLPAGGGTPLAAGLICALEEARRSAGPALLVVLTDGRANVSVSGEPVWDELERVAAAVRQSKIPAVVIDTGSIRPSAGRLAEMLGAQYVPLPRLDAGAVHRCVAEAAGAMR